MANESPAAVQTGTFSGSAGSAAKTTMPTLAKAPMVMADAPTQAAENKIAATVLGDETAKAVRYDKPVTAAPVIEPTASPEKQAAAAKLGQDKAALVESENVSRANAAHFIEASIIKETRATGPDGLDAKMRQRQTEIEKPRGTVQEGYIEKAKPAVPANDAGVAGGDVDAIAAAPRQKGPSRRAGAVAAVVATAAVGTSADMKVTAPAADAKFGTDASPAAIAAAPVSVTASRSSAMSEYRPSTARGSVSFLEKMGIGTGIKIPEPSAASVFREGTTGTAPAIAAPARALAFKPAQPIPGTQGAPAFTGAEPEKVSVRAGAKPQHTPRKAQPVYGMGPTNTGK